MKAVSYADGKVKTSEIQKPVCNPILRSQQRRIDSQGVSSEKVKPGGKLGL